MTKTETAIADYMMGRALREREAERQGAPPVVYGFEHNELDGLEEAMRRERLRARPYLSHLGRNS